MTRDGQNRQGVPELGFAAPVAVELLTLGELRSRAGRDGLLDIPARPAFHHLLTVSRGTVRHTVDFTTHVVSPVSGRG